MARIEINPAGIRDLLRSDGVAEMLRAKAEQVKAAADSAGILVQWPGEPRIPMPYELRVTVGRNRARATVAAAHPSGIQAEAEYHTLVGALDAAR